MKDNSNDLLKQEIIQGIFQAKHELDIIRQNYEYSEPDLVDYYLYQIKANQSKLDYLIKKAKKQNIHLDAVDEIYYYHVV